MDVLSDRERLFVVSAVNKRIGRVGIAWRSPDRVHRVRGAGMKPKNFAGRKTLRRRKANGLTPQPTGSIVRDIRLRVGRKNRNLDGSAK